MDISRPERNLKTEQQRRHAHERRRRLNEKRDFFKQEVELLQKPLRHFRYISSYFENTLNLQLN